MKIYTIHDLDSNETFRKAFITINEAANEIMKSREDWESTKDAGSIESDYLITEIYTEGCVAVNATDECEEICKSIWEEILKQREYTADVYRPIVL